MIKKLLFPLVFGVVLAGYSTFALLDTFVVEQPMQDVSFDSHFFDDFPTTSSSAPTSSSKPSSSSNVPSSSKQETSSSSVVSSSSSSSSSITPSVPGPIEFPATPIYTDTPTYTDNSYTDSHMCITIIEETIQVKNKKGQMVDTVVYCADIYLTSAQYMKTALAKDKYGQKIVEHTSSMAERHNAVFAINGDYYGAQERGYVLRNGTVFRDSKKTADMDKGDLAIYTDGSFETFKEADKSVEDMQALKLDVGIKAYQIFSFGPILAEDGKTIVTEKDEVAISSKLGNQRTAIGIIDNLHYRVAVCDGRLSSSWGMELYQMADYMVGKGCKTVYNLDGGGSSTIWFNGRLLNRPNTNGEKDIGEREISDCVYFA